MSCWPIRAATNWDSVLHASSLTVRPRRASIGQATREKPSQRTDLVIQRLTYVGKSGTCPDTFVSWRFRSSDAYIVCQPPKGGLASPSHSHSIRPPHGRFYPSISYGSETNRHVRSGPGGDRAAVAARSEERRVGKEWICRACALCEEYARD